MMQHLSLPHYILFIGCWAVTGIFAGCYLLQKEAPYGRYTSEKWGPMVSNKFGWLLMETTVLVSFFVWLPLKQFNWWAPAGTMVLMFVIHYVHRSFVYPFMIRTKGKKMPLVIMLSAMLFNTVNGSLLGIWFARFAHYPDNWYTTPAFVLGSACFGAGLLINWTSDYHLIHLRKKNETGYKIPQRGLFKYISSPNLLGEIMEWGGYALLTWSLPGLAFFIWTCANLVPRALANHRWYRQQFPDYPANRKALLPFIW
ncbi:3-oxo-5-alpha-steroid 4-dehydrogenase [Chitinophaga sp. MM2321]|uniref:3-oxo-5-alpha-steroid 4-dehydrogenase n=1 Tax=Chitinophaga sp. MM2321 TaxID=3137178 RepID=UPI0032D58D5C